MSSPQGAPASCGYAPASAGVPAAAADASAYTDDALLLRVCERDETAFAELVQRHLRPVHTYLLRMTRSCAEAEDLAQETFLRIWQKASAYKPGKVRATTWIHTIAHNLCVDGFRRHGAKVGQFAGSELSYQPGGRNELIDTGSDPFLQHSATETRSALLAALGALPESQRAAFVLCQMQAFSNAQAAEILGVNVRALESLLARARRTLREAISDGNRENTQGQEYNT